MDLKTHISCLVIGSTFEGTEKRYFFLDYMYFRNILIIRLFNELNEILREEITYYMVFTSHLIVINN